jgi:hypothetical protein
VQVLSAIRLVIPFYICVVYNCSVKCNLSGIDAADI